MDRRFLRYYERELRHVRESAGEFSREFPKIAGRLSLDGMECADPYVERLLEGFAYLAARVQLKLDAEFPRFTNHLIESVYPHYLCPTPSMAVVQIQPDLEDSGLASGFTVPRDTALRSNVGRSDQTACEFRTAHEISLWPLELIEAEYHDRDLASLELPSSVRARAAIRLRIRATAGLMMNELELDRLPVFLQGAGETPFRIYERIFGHTTGVLVRPTTRPARWTATLKPDRLRQLGFEEGEAMLPAGPRTFQGYRFLQEYFAFPSRFMFFELSGLRRVLEGSEQTQLELVFLLDEPDVDLDEAVSAENFRLHCTPAINLFPKRADRIHLSDRFSEFQVVADRTRPLDYEVYDVLGATAFGAKASDEQEFRPFYAASDDDEAGDEGAYFAINRVPRTMSDRERRTGRRSSYPGSEVYISLVDAHAAPYRSDLRQLQIVTRCTNRDLPLRMPVGAGRTDFSMEIGAAVERVRCIAGPTHPRPSFAEGETAWRIISHLTLNYLSLSDTDERQGAAALRELLRIYGDIAEPAVRKQIDGVRSISTRPISRRVPTPGPIAFARGLEVSVRMDGLSFEGSGVFLLGAVLDRFLARYVSINSFTETVITTQERGEIMRWPTRLGQRHTL